MEEAFKVNGVRDEANVEAGLLRDVSRSFYLTLRVLPAKIRSQIGLAYLLARTTDTVADTELVPLEERLLALSTLRERILGRTEAPLNFARLAACQASSAERVLLEKCEESLALLCALSPADLLLVREVLETITSGQILDLKRFASAAKENVIALSNEEELEDYTYRVAGCVGEFWTRMCRAHVFPQAPLNDEALLRDAVRFGKGLQLVNILRDLSVDLRQGRCYLPSDQLHTVGLKPADLLLPERESQLRPVYDSWLDLAEANLQAGWRYTNCLPLGSVRIRLACAWPILIGFRTLQLLREGSILDPEKRIKVGRREVKILMMRSILAYLWPAAWRRLAPAPLREPRVFISAANQKS
jgi:farnesyl-diphosphate farnesyltransferase